MRLLIQNNSSDAFTYADSTVVIAASATTEVQSLNWFALFSDLNFVRDLRLNNIQVGDGLKFFLPTEGENYMRLITNDIDWNNRDTDGALIMRMKAAKKGWSFWAVPVEITTSTLSGTMFCQTSDGNNIPWVNCKIYDGNNAEITTAGLANINLATCVKTVIDFEPTFDYEIIGGALRINSNPSQDVRMWIVGAPDIPAIYGGSKEFASGINLKFLAPDSSFEIDGRVTKFLSYNAATHQGKMRIILKHPAGSQVNMQLIVHIYRQ